MNDRKLLPKLIGSLAMVLAGFALSAQAVVESVPFTKLDDVLGPLLDFYKSDQAGAEHPQDFGDWADGRGVSSLTALLPSFGR